MCGAILCVCVCACVVRAWWISIFDVWISSFRAARLYWMIKRRERKRIRKIAQILFQIFWPNEITSFVLILLITNKNVYCALVLTCINTHSALRHTHLHTHTAYTYTEMRHFCDIYRHFRPLILAEPITNSTHQMRKKTQRERNEERKNKSKMETKINECGMASVVAFAFAIAHNRFLCFKWRLMCWWRLAF